MSDRIEQRRTVGRLFDLISQINLASMQRSAWCSEKRSLSLRSIAWHSICIGMVAAVSLRYTSLSTFLPHSIDTNMSDHSHSA